MSPIVSLCSASAVWLSEGDIMCITLRYSFSFPLVAVPTSNRWVHDLFCGLHSVWREVRLQEQKKQGSVWTGSVAGLT